jgi:hypothetical protein
LSNRSDGDYIAFGPPASGLTLTMVSRHNWEKNWRKPKQHLREQIGRGDLDFLFDAGKFEEPKNFNRDTQRLKKEQPVPEYEFDNIAFAQLPDFTKVVYEILVNGEWQKIEDIDYANKQILLANGELIPIPDFNTLLMIRRVR